MKTPDEIKKGLECCGGDCFSGNEACPYDKDDLKENVSCIRWLAIDALAYIKQLEAEKAELLEKIKQLEAERDAAIKDIPRACRYCKHYVHSKTHLCRSKKPCANISGINTAWEWRGMRGEEQT